MLKKILIALSVLLNVGLLIILLFSVGIFGSNEQRAAYFFSGCAEDFRCLEKMQFIYLSSFNGSLEDYQGDVYACKTRADSPYTFLSTTKSSEDFAKCVKMTEKYKGLGTYAIQSDSTGGENIEEVKIEFDN